MTLRVLKTEDDVKRPDLADVPDEKGTYAQLVEIVRENRLDVLGGAELAFDEMSGEILLGSVALDDVGVDRMRESIETKIVNSKGKPIKVNAANAMSALRQVAHENRFHPVQRYLRSLTWDGVKRIEKIAPDVLGASKPISSVIMKRFFVGAVARPMEPGCKLDTALILVGDQDLLKSTFFDRLAGSFFTDTPISIGSKDAYETIRHYWITELAELEGIKRARDVDAIKAFMSSRVDCYRPSYARLSIKVPRAGAIVGTTNTGDFLTDPTGSRRFWPIEVTKRIDVERVARDRDQLWAEARALYEAGEPWWLSPEEGALLGEVHREHEAGDAWESTIVGWSKGRTARFTTADVWVEAFSKKIGDLTRGDEMRIAAVLSRNGFSNRGPGTKSNGVRYWKARASQ
jgi:putative DNA primase/helicase